MFCIAMFRTALCLLFSVSLFAHTHALPAYSWGDEPKSPLGSTFMCARKVSRPPLCSTPGTCLSPPPWNSRLLAVVLGVGTQNYTCSSAGARPTGNGAVAHLYDITCLVATYPDAAHLTSATAIRAKVHTIQDATAGKVPLGLGYPEIGYHDFSDRTTAVFKVNIDDEEKVFVGGRWENIPAPGNAIEGTVDWLKLGRTKGLEKQSEGIKFVYRVHTAGGRAPATCKGKGEYTVDYATEYWLYG